MNIVNGGPGSGNFNPSQGRGVGKPSSLSNLVKSAIDKTYSKSNTYYRGLSGEFAEKIKSLKKGDTITDKGFMSMSSDIGNGNSGASQFGNVILKIKTKSCYGQTIYLGDISSFQSESETLLNAGSTIEFTGETSREKAGDNPITIYEYEVV